MRLAMLVTLARRCLRQQKVFSPLFASVPRARYCTTIRGNQTTPTTQSYPSSVASSPHTSESTSSSSQSTKWKKSEELPYINQDEVLDTLDTYVQSHPIRNVLVLWGPKSTGKTGSLLTKAREWEEKGHPVIQVDLKGFDKTLPTFINLFYEATINALTRKHEHLPEELIQRALKKQKEKKISSLATISDNNITSTSSSLVDIAKSATFHLKAYLGTIIAPNTRMIKPAQQKQSENWEAEKVGPWFALMRQFIKDRLRGGDFVSVLGLLEEISQLQTGARKTPIFILREMDYLEVVKKEDRTIFAELMNYFEAYKQGQKKLPIIIESTGHSKTQWQHSLSSFESFKFLLVDHWKKADAEKTLVTSTLPGQSGPIFTPQEFEQVWEFSGGHAGTIYQLHALLRDGKTIAEAQAAILRRAEITLLEFMPTTFMLRNRRMEFLQTLRSNNYKMPITQELLTAQVFVDSDVLFFDGADVMPRNKVVQAAIEVLLQKDKELRAKRNEEKAASEAAKNEKEKELEREKEIEEEAKNSKKKDLSNKASKKK